MNTVLTVFEADGKPLFDVADQVEERLRKLSGNPPSLVNGNQNQITQQAQAVAAAVESSNGKQVASERSATRAVIAETEKRVAARRAEAKAISEIPISLYRPGSASASSSTVTGKTPAQILFESGDPGARVNAGANSLQRLANLERQMETADRLANIKPQETGFASYFRNLQNDGAANGGAVGNSLFNLNSARPFQGLGVAFRATGLSQFGLDETVLNAITVAARQMGIIKTASAEAAASETIFASETKIAAVGMADTAGGIKILGAGLVPIAATLAAGVVSILAAKKLSEDIREQAEKRLHAEESITAEFNKQNQATADLQNKLKDEAKARQFNTFVQSDDIFALSQARNNLQQQFDENLRARDSERDRRDRLVHDIAGGNAIADANKKFVEEATPKDFDKTQTELTNKISDLNSKLYELKQNYKSFPADVHQGVEDLLKSREENLRKAEEDRRKAEEATEKQISKIKELANSARAAFETVFAREAGRNPFLSFLDDVAKRTEVVRKQTQGLGSDIRNALLSRNNQQNLLDLSQLHYNASTNAFNLRDEANAFTRFSQTGSTDSFEVRSLKNFIADQGPLSDERKKFFDDWLADAQKKDFQDRLDKQIDIARTSFLNGPAGDSSAARSLFDQAVIKATPLDQVNRLSQNEIQQAIAARQEEANHQLQQEAEASTQRAEQIALETRLAKALEGLLARIDKGKGLPVDLGGQEVFGVDVKSSGLSVTTQRSSSPGRPKTTAESMGFTDTFQSSGHAAS